MEIGVEISLVPEELKGKEEDFRNEFKDPKSSTINVKYSEIWNNEN